ncbi:ABC transporter ATP-binding protein [Coralloluteibacterium stylophorae]|uniref:ABC transporter ATP-binding protein n=1 Tax=Coralloluteibacterium stylophorae TaxID=1776034 RepID=A0A8J7VRK4_9GAMM|nr:ABC transporter ATP-binding protein [Coralloluteibacterium stylophorae]MBS7457086.1 ABC transporter ATP-binding protein [Coralloluteibacterium stylophorae]
MSALLEVQRVRVRLEGRDVLDDLSLALERGALATLVGANGSGKTRLIHAVAGLQPLASGAIRIDGVPLAADPGAARARLGFAVDPSRLPAPLSPRQCLELFARSRGLARIDAETLAFAEQVRLAPWLDTPVGACSLGTRQKLAIALALVGTPPLLLLDEALNGLDPVAAVDTFDHLRRLADDGRCGVLLATHGLELAVDRADRLLLIEAGRLAADWDAQALAQARGTGGIAGAVVAHLRAAQAAR